MATIKFPESYPIDNLLARECAKSKRYTYADIKFYDYDTKLKIMVQDFRGDVWGEIIPLFLDNGRISEIEAVKDYFRRSEILFRKF